MVTLRPGCSEGAGSAKISMVCQNLALYLFLSALSALSAVKSYPVWADDGERVFSAPDIVVTARRSEESLDHVPASVSVVSHDDLTLIPAHDVGELLNFLPGLNIQRSGGVGQPVIPSIQGADHRHVLILLDGIPMNTLAEGLGSLEEIGLAAVDRIEVVKGPGSAVWGSSLGGVINILSRPIRSQRRLPSIAASTSYGRWATQRHTLTVSGGAAGTGYLASWERTTSDGSHPKSAHAANHGFVKLNTGIVSQGLLTAFYGVTDGETEENFQDPRRPFWRLFSFTNHHGGLRFTWAASRRWQGTATIDGIRRTNGVTFFQKGETIPVQSLRAPEYTLGPGFQIRTEPSARHILLIGGEFDVSTIDFSWSGGVSDQRVYQSAFYVSESYDLWRLTMLGGVRYDRNSAYGKQVSPTIGIVIRVPPDGIRALLDSTMIRATVARGFSAPPLLIKYLPETVDEAPNPDIKPERSWTTQVGVETWLYRRIGITFTAYQANVRDAIQTVENEKGQAVDRNFARFRRRGLEAELQLKLLTGFSAFGGVTVNHVTDLSTGDVVYGPPRRTYDVRLTYRHPSGSSAGLVGHYAWYRVNPGYYSPRFMFTTKDRRFLWDLKVAHTFPIHAGKIGVTLSVYNLFNTPSWWISPFPLPPRWVEGGIRYEL